MSGWKIKRGKKKAWCGMNLSVRSHASKFDVTVTVNVTMIQVKTFDTCVKKKLRKKDINEQH